MKPDTSLAVVRRLLVERQRVNDNLHNVARAMFQPGIQIRYQINDNEYFGTVIDVIGIPGTTRVRVCNLRTQRQRDIHLCQITGIVQED